MRYLKNIIAFGSLLMTAVNAEPSHTVLSTAAGGTTSTTLTCSDDDGICSNTDYFMPSSSVVAHGNIPGRFLGTLTFGTRYADDKIDVTIGLVDTVLASSSSTIDSTARDVHLSWDSGESWIPLMDDGIAADSYVKNHITPVGHTSGVQIEIEFIVQFRKETTNTNNIHFGRIATDLSIKVQSTGALSSDVAEVEKDLLAGVSKNTITLAEEYKLAAYTPPPAGEYTFEFLATADQPDFESSDATAWYSKTSTVKPHTVSIVVVDTRYTFGSTDDIDASQTVEKALICILQANRKSKYDSSSFFAAQTLSQDCTVSEKAIIVDSNNKNRLRLRSTSALDVLEFELGVGNPKRKYFTGSTGCNDESCVGALQLKDGTDVIASTQGVNWAHEAENAIRADVGYSIQKEETTVHVGELGPGYLSDATVPLSELFTFGIGVAYLLDLDSTIQFDAPTVSGGVTLKDCPSIAAKAIYEFDTHTQLVAQASTAFEGCKVEEAAAPYKVDGVAGSVVTLSNYFQDTDQNVASSEIYYRASEIDTSLVSNAIGQVKYTGSGATNGYLAADEVLESQKWGTRCMNDGTYFQCSPAASSGLFDTSFKLSTTLQDYILAQPNCALTDADLSDLACKLPLSLAGTLSDASHEFRNGVERKLCKDVTQSIDVSLELTRKDSNVIRHDVAVTKEYRMDASSTISAPVFASTLTALTGTLTRDRNNDFSQTAEVDVKYYGFVETPLTVNFDVISATRDGNLVSLSDAPATMTCGGNPFVVTYQYAVSPVCDSAPGTLTVTQEVDFKYTTEDLAISIVAADLSVGISEKYLFEQSHMNGQDGITVTLNRADTSGDASADPASDGLSRLRVRCQDPLECKENFGQTWLDCPNGVCTVKYVDKGVYTSPTDDTRYNYDEDGDQIPFVLEFGIKHSTACDSTESIQYLSNQTVTFQVSDSDVPFKGAILLGRPHADTNNCNLAAMVGCTSLVELPETPHEITFPSSYVVLEAYIDDKLPKGHTLYPVWESEDDAVSLQNTKKLALTFTKPAGTDEIIYTFNVKVNGNLKDGPKQAGGNPFIVHLESHLGDNLCNADDLAYGAPMNDEKLTVEIYQSGDLKTLRTFEIKLRCGAGPMNLVYANTFNNDYALPLEGQYQRIPETGSLVRDEFNSFALKLKQSPSFEKICGGTLTVPGDQECAFKNPRPATITIASKIPDYLDDSKSDDGGAIGVGSSNTFVEYTARVCTTDVPMEIVLKDTSFADKTFNFKVRCVRNTLDGADTQIEDEVSLDYRIASFVYGKGSSTLNFYRDPVKWSSNTAHVDSHLWFGSCNDASGNGYGAKADCTIATAVGAKTDHVFSKTAGAMLTLINTCGAVANTGDATKFSSKVTVARKYKRGAEYDNAEFCGESALTLEVVKIGTATAQIAVAAALEVDFQVFIKELEWETCSDGDGYRMVMSVMNKYDADGVNVATTNYAPFDTTTAANILSNYASSLSGTGTTYTHGETGVIVVEGNCIVGTACTDFGGDDGLTTETSYVLQQKVGNNYYAAPISLTANMQCPLGDTTADAESIEVDVVCTIGVGETGAACNTDGIDAESIFQLAIPNDDGHGFTLKVVEIRITIGTEAESTLIAKDNFGDLIQAPMPYEKYGNYYPNGVHLYALRMAGKSVTVKFEYSRETQRRLRALNLASSSSASFYVLPASIMEQTNAEEAPATAAAAIQQEIPAAGEDVVLQNSGNDSDEVNKAKTDDQFAQDTSQGWVIAVSVSVLVVGVLVLMFLRYQRGQASVVLRRSKRAGYTAAVGGRFQSRIQF